MGAAVAADRESCLRRRPAGDQPPLVEVVDAAPHRAPRVLVDPAQRAMRLGMIGSFLEHGCDSLLGLGGPAEAPEDEPEHAHRPRRCRDPTRAARARTLSATSNCFSSTSERAASIKSLLRWIPGWRVARQRQHIARAPVPASDPDPRLPVVQDPLEVLRACRLDRAPVSGPEPSQRLVDGAADRLPVDGEAPAGTPSRGASPRPPAVPATPRRARWTARRAIRRSRTCGRGATSNGRRLQPAAIMNTPRSATPCRTPSS